MNQLLQAHVTVEDDGVFTMPWTTSSLLHRGVSTVLTTPFGPLRVTSAGSGPAERSGLCPVSSDRVENFCKSRPTRGANKRHLLQLRENPS